MPSHHSYHDPSFYAIHPSPLIPPPTHTAFCQKWGSDPRYSSSLRAMVSMNGFLYPDPQLTSILHSAGQVFESTPHNRPDIPISYWSRFVFSEDYLQVCVCVYI